MSLSAESSATPDVPAGVRHDRVRFASFQFARTPAGTCTAAVELELEGRRVAGEANGASSPFMDLRVSAEAALKALERYTENAVSFELIGVKMVRAFDANLVIVAVTRRGTNTRLVGCYLADDDTNRGAALAILNATNRILGNYLATR